MANCLIFYNTSVITQALHDLAREGHTIPSEAIAGLSPHMTRHIDRFGHYEINAELEAPPLTYDLPALPKRARTDERNGA